MHEKTILKIRRKGEKMITFYLIPDFKRFIDLVKKSSGDVLLNMKDGSVCSLKHDEAAMKIFSEMKPRKSDVRLSFTCKDDVIAFVRYMGESAYD